MSVYTVHRPPPRAGEASADPQRFAFVRDGFHFWAFLLGPFWMLFRRLWIVTVLYLVVVAAAGIVLWMLRADAFTHTAADFFLAVLVGFEAATLRRWTLDRAGWKTVGVVVGDDLEAAERRFFAAWSEQKAKPPAPGASLPAMKVPASTAHDVLGLFPEPGGQR